MCEPNSDGKWGLSYQDVDQFFSYSYYGNQHNVNFYGQEPCSGGYYHENEYSIVDNEVLVQSLQQGLSAISIADGSKLSNAVEEHVPASYLVEEHLLVSYPVEKHLPVTYPGVEEHLPVTYPGVEEHMPVYYPVEEHLPVSYPVGRHLPVTYPVEEHMPVHYPVEEHLQVNYLVEGYVPVSYPVQEHLHVPRPVEQFHAFTGNQNWYYGPSPWNYHYGAAGEETKKMGPSSPCSSPGNESCDYEEANSCNLDITDELEPDGEPGKKPTSVPHTPKVNGDIPSTAEASSDYQRLLDRLQLYNMIESPVEGDGNCQFRALSDQLYHTPDYHKSVRRRVVIQLKSNPELYEEYVPMAYIDYVRQISMSREWGDHITLQAAADSYGVKIFVLTSFKDTDFIEILPKVFKSRKVVFLSYWAEVHYNSIYPKGELPTSGYLKKKKKKNKQKWSNMKNMHQADHE